MSTATCPECGYDTGWISDHAFCRINADSERQQWKRAVADAHTQAGADAETGRQLYRLLRDNARRKVFRREELTALIKGDIK